MISVEEARRIIDAQVPALPLEDLPLSKAIGRFTGRDIRSPHDHPLFDQSAVDGYALSGVLSEWRVVGEVAAGEVFPRPLKPGECARIFTGAMIPEGADTVVMQEFCTRSLDRLTHTDEKLRKGANMRRRGEHVGRGDVVLLKGTCLSAHAAGLLASVAITQVEVARRPNVAVVVSGNEFAMEAAGEEGKIFSSNDVMLDAALDLASLDRSTLSVPDDRAALSRALMEATKKADVIITTGGVSVGDHDLIHPVLAELGAEIFLHRVAQKPGKPMLFATLNGKPVFGLPGNPRAVMILFWEHVLPFLRAMQGAREPGLKKHRLPITHALTVKGERAEFRAALVNDGRVTLLADEGSHMLRSLIDADALVYIPPDQRAINAGDLVEVHYLPS